VTKAISIHANGGPDAAAGRTSFLPPPGRRERERKEKRKDSDSNGLRGGVYIARRFNFPVIREKGRKGRQLTSFPAICFHREKKKKKGRRAGDSYFPPEKRLGAARRRVRPAMPLPCL